MGRKKKSGEAGNGRARRLATWAARAAAGATVGVGAGALLAPGLLLAPAELAGQSRCEHREVEELSAASAGSLDVEAGAGRLMVTGRDGTGDVRVTAVLCASSQEALEGLEVTLEGDRLRTDYPDWRGRWGGRNYARIDLEVAVPRGMDVRVEDGSGSMVLSGVGQVRVKDGSGEIRVRDAMEVVVEDGSGSLQIEDVAGNVEIEDGSGSLRVREVAGDVEVSDGSGSIEIEAVGGSVRVDGMGSGGLSVRDVEGDLVVGDGRRERIRYSDIRGSLDLPPARRRGGGN